MSQQLKKRISKKFRPLFTGDYLYYAFYGGRGGGKSHAVAEYAIWCAMNNKEKIFTARQFRSSIDLSSKALYEDKILSMGLSSEFRILDKSIECKRTGSVFHFIGLERNTDSIRSLEGATLTILEEAQNLPFHAIRIIEETVMRSKRSRMVFNWNPINKHDPVDIKFRSSSPPDRSWVAPIGWRDNPFFQETNLPAQMERMRQTNYSLYKHVWEGDYFGGVDQRIFNNWEVRHINVPDNIFPQYGLDFGTVDPNAAVKLYVNEKEKWIYIAREFRIPGTTDAVLRGLEGLVDKRTAKIVCDSAWPQSIAIIKKEYPNAVAAKKGKNSVVTGIKWLQDHRIYIAPDCKRMQEEAEKYNWQIDRHSVNDDGSPVTMEEPEDENNHLWDAVRYATEQNRLEKQTRVGIRLVRI